MKYRILLAALLASTSLVPAYAADGGVYSPAAASLAAAQQAHSTPIAAATAAEFVQKVGDEAVSTLANKALNKEQRDAKFRDLLRRSFNLHVIGRYALGRQAWALATEPQRQQYMDLFEQLVIKIYSDRFAFYSGETFNVVSSRPENNRDTAVISQVKQPNNPQPIDVTWRVRNSDGTFGITDVSVEGVSMVLTQKQEFASVLQRNNNDINKLMDLIRSRVQTNAQQASAQ